MNQGNAFFPMIFKRASLLLLFLLILVPVHAQEDDTPPWLDQQQRLRASDLPNSVEDPNDANYFGRGIAIKDDIAIVGAMGADLNGLKRVGAVYIYQRHDTKWIEIAKVSPPVPKEDGAFGSSFAFDGHTLAITGPSTTNQTPGYTAVYLFHRTGDEWVFDTVINDVDADAPSPTAFGSPVKITGDTLAIGAPWIDVTMIEHAPSQGKMHLYHRVNGAWELETTLISSSPRMWSKYGVSAELDEAGDTLVVGTFNEFNIYVYQHQADGWTLQQIITDPTALWAYGGVFSLSHDGNTLVVGAPFEFNAQGVQTGAVHIHEFDGVQWNLKQKLSPDDPLVLNNFGIGVDIDRDTLFVTSNWEPPGQYHVRGAAYVFKRKDGYWSQQAKLVTFDNKGFDENTSIDWTAVVSGEYGLASASNSDTRLTAAYAFKIPGVEEQTAPAPDQSGLLPLPHDTNSTYPTFGVTLKTRPTTEVKLRLKTDGSALLDNGGVADSKLTLTFTRKNWNIPQTVRVRAGADQSTAVIAPVSYKIKGSSAIEYLWVTPTDSYLNVPADTFQQVSPADAAVLSAAPVTFTWQPYGLATRYTLKLVSVGGSYQFQQKLSPADVCAANICSFTLTEVLAGQTQYQWQVVAKDQPGKFKKKSEWRSLTVTP